MASEILAARSHRITGAPRLSRAGVLAVPAVAGADGALLAPRSPFHALALAAQVGFYGLAVYGAAHLVGRLSRTQHPSRLIALGAVHGNETCGTRAIERLLAELAAGRQRIVRGRLTLVPVTNRLAYERGTRGGRGVGGVAQRAADDNEVRSSRTRLRRRHHALLVRDHAILDRTDARRDADQRRRAGCADHHAGCGG